MSEYRLQKFVKISGGKCAIGSDNVYEWQEITPLRFESYNEAKDHAIKFMIHDDCRVTDGKNFWAVS